MMPTPPAANVFRTARRVTGIALYSNGAARPTARPTAACSATGHVGRVRGLPVARPRLGAPRRPRRTAAPRARHRLYRLRSHGVESPCRHAAHDHGTRSLAALRPFADRD